MHVTYGMAGTDGRYSMIGTGDMVGKAGTDGRGGIDGTG